MTAPEGIPQDTGWAWLAALGAAVNCFCSMGSSRVAGIFFVELMEEFGSSASLSALMFGIRMASYTITSISAPILRSKFSYRTLGMIGGMSYTMAHSLLAVAPNMYYVVFVYGIFSGAGYALSIICSNAVVALYFKKWHALVAGLMFSSAGLGVTVIPQILIVFFERYSIFGVMLIFGGISMQMVAGSTLYRPASFYRRCKKDARKTDDTSEMVKIISNGVGQTKIYNMHTISHENQKMTEQSHQYQFSSKIVPVSIAKDTTLNNNDSNNSMEHGHKVVPRDSIKTVSHQEQLTKSEQNSKTNTGIVLTVDRLSNDESNPCSQKPVNRDPSESRKTLPKKLFDMLSFQLFSDSKFSILVFGCVTGLTASMSQSNFALPHLRQSGLSNKEVAMILTTSGMVDLVARTIWGWLGSRWIQPTHIIAMCSGLAALAVTTCAFMGSFGAMLCIIVLPSALGSTVMVLSPPILKTMVPRARFLEAYALVHAFHGLLYTILPPVFGAVKDATGGYKTIMVCNGMIFVLTSLSFTTLSYLLKKARR